MSEYFSAGFLQKIACIGILLTVGVVLVNVLANGLIYTSTDYPTHVVKLYFLEKIGYGATTLQWNHPIGYTLFQTYPPLFFAPALALLHIFRFAGFPHALEMSFALLGIIIACAIFVLARKYFFSRNRETLFWWGVVFFNPLSINWIFETGRFPELMGWAIFTIIWGLRLRFESEDDHRAAHDASQRARTTPFWKRVGIMGLFFALQMIAHPGVFIMATLAWFLFALPRLRSEWKFHLAAWGLGLVLSAWWWIPYRAASAQLVLSHYVGLTLLAQNIFVNAFNLLAVGILILLALALHRVHHAWKWPLTGLSIIGILELSGWLSRIPILNQPQQQMYVTFFFFIGILACLRFRTRILEGLPFITLPSRRALATVICIGLLGMSIYSIEKFHDMSEKNDLTTKWDTQLDEIAPHIRDVFACFPDCGAALSYWVVVHGKSTTDNFSPEATPLIIRQWKQSVRALLAQENCSADDSLFAQLPVSEMVTDTSFCTAFRACGFSPSFVSRDWCVFPITR